MNEQHIWDLWYPNAGAQGLSFARGRLDATASVLVHAAPETFDLDVRMDNGTLVARGRNLNSTGDFPIARLTIENGEVSRVDAFPSDDEIGLPVILPGGEVGILLSWWNANDGSAWRWRIEFYNHR